MTWIDELRGKVNRRQSEEPREVRNEGLSDDAVVPARMLVLRLLGQINQELLGGRGSLWESQSRWDARLWELWWGGTRTEGQHIVVTLLRDSRGSAYLKVQRRRLALHDPTLERRLKRALQAAFLQPGVYRPANQETSGTNETPWDPSVAL